MRIIAVIFAALMLSGCIARTAAAVVTAPVKVVAQAADWATTSQDEADRNRGREIREQEEQLGRDYRECIEEYDEAYCYDLYYRRPAPSPEE